MNGLVSDFCLDPIEVSALGSKMAGTITIVMEPSAMMVLSGERIFMDSLTNLAFVECG
jgi:hypothetical protein